MSFSAAGIPSEHKIPIPSEHNHEHLTFPPPANPLRYWLLMFCTMHISLADSAEKTALLLRHRGTQMLYRHYLAKLVPKEEAERYFALSPASV